VPTILSDLGLESPLVGMAVTAHISSSGPDGFRCVVHDVATGRRRDALLPRADAYALPEGAAPPVLRADDTVVALVVGVTGGEGDGGERLMLSTTAPKLVERILAGFVDEMLTGRVVITNIARVAGTKCKVAVAPTAPGVDARGACIGRGASRLKGAERLLNRGFGREKLEIIEFASDRATFLRNAMNPVQATEVLVERDLAVVAIEEHQLSGGIGQGGLNAELAGRLTDLYVRVVKAGTDLREAMDRLAAEASAPSGAASH
jgi:transcription antitermination factor NusA-like protein